MMTDHQEPHSEHEKPGPEVGPPANRMNRRIALKWMLTAAAAVAVTDTLAGTTPDQGKTPGGSGYGSDPDLNQTYKPGDHWPLTLSASQKRTVTALCDVIIPADADSPSASAVGVPDFIDEWISAPYPTQAADRPRILEGLAWLEDESGRRFAKTFPNLSDTEKSSICDEICYLAEVKADLKPAAVFFARFRNLAAGAFYTTPEGTKDLKYVGNMPLARWEGPPAEVLAKVGLI